MGHGQETSKRLSTMCLLCVYGCRCQELVVHWQETSGRLMDPHLAHVAETLQKEYIEGLCVSECLCAECLCASKRLVHAQLCASKR